MMAEVYGRVDGLCKGLGGSMHLTDVKRGFLGTSGIVGAGIPHAAGAAWAAQIRRQGFTCDKPLRAARDSKHSRPDRGVWVLKCSNARYRITRAPDMAAKVEPLL